MSRVAVRKTYKLYIGGAFPRSESGRTYEAEGQNVARASRKDARDAVKAAVMVEEVARTVHVARQLGPTIPIQQDDIDSLYARYQNVYGQTITEDRS